jgi:hypothetical protein
MFGASSNPAYLCGRPILDHLRILENSSNYINRREDDEYRYKEEKRRLRQGCKQGCKQVSEHLGKSQ